MEHFVLEKMRHIIGFSDGDSILAPGGAISNLYSIIVARHKMFPEYKSKGMRGLAKQPVLFTSEHVSRQLFCCCLDEHINDDHDHDHHDDDDII